MYRLKHTMQVGATHTPVHTVLRQCHDFALMVHSYRCELSTVAYPPVRKNKTTLPYILIIKWKIKTNPSSAETGTFHENLVNTIADDDPAPCVGNTSAAMLLITWDKRDSDKNPTHMIDLDKFMRNLNVFHLKSLCTNYYVHFTSGV